MVDLEASESMTVVAVVAAMITLLATYIYVATIMASDVSASSI